jgi:hypothetical protein
LEQTLSITTDVSDEVALVTPGDFLVGRNILKIALQAPGDPRPVPRRRVYYLWRRMCQNGGAPFSPICLACEPDNGPRVAQFHSVVFSAKDILKNADKFIKTRRLRKKGGTLKDFNRLCAALEKKFDPPRKSDDES